MRHPVTAFLAVIAAASVGYVLSPWGQDVFQPLVAIATAATCVDAARRTPRNAPVWYLLGAGVYLWGLGHAVGVWLDGSSWAIPFPSPADALHVVGYLAVGAATAMIARQVLAGSREPGGGFVEVGLLLVAAGVVVWDLAVEPASLGDGNFETFVAATYPALDAVLAATLLQLYVATQPRIRSLVLLAAGFGVTMVPDLLYARGLLIGEHSHAALLDALWIAGIALIGVAALESRGRVGRATKADRFAIRGRTSLLVVAMALPLVLVALRPGDHEHQLAVGAMWLLALARLGYLLVDNERLAASSARDASLLHATLDAVEEAVLVTDLALRPVAHNRQFRELWRIPDDLLDPVRAEGLLAHMASLVAGPAAADPEARVLVVQEGGAGEELVLRDGRTLRRTSRAQRLDGEVVGRVWSFRDVTRERAAERALRETSRRLREVFQNAQLLVATLDPEMRIVHCNAHFLQVTGWKRRQLVGRLWHEAVVPSEAEAAIAAAAMERHRAGEASEHHLNEIVTKTGERRLIAWNSSAVRGLDAEIASVTLIGFDVTAQTRATDELRRQERRARALLENSFDLTLVLDASGRIVEDIAVGTNALGYAAGALVGRLLDEIADPQDAERVRALHALVASSPGKSVPFEWRFVGRSGASRVLDGFATNLLGDPAVGGIVVNARDVTVARDAEEKLQASRAQLMHAQKLEAVARLAGGVAHDFNNLLTAIRGYSELLLLQLETGHPARGDATEIGAAAARAAALTRQLLAFSRRQVLQPIVLQPNEIVEDMESLLQRLIGEDVTLETDLEEGVGLVRADPSQLEQVLANLVVNARDAMPDGGTIVVSTRSLEHGPDGAGPVVCLTVADTGSGMDEETKARAFDPFFTTKDQGHGTGLGLATVHGIVTQTGGQVTIDSEPGRGTRIDVLLPRADGVPAESPEPAEPPKRGSETILLVEDEALVRDLARRVLTGRGYQVLEVGDSPDAVGVCESYGGRIDLLLTDVVMPRLNGFELAERLRMIRPDLQVLYMSGYAAPEILRGGLQEGDSAFLPKPFTPDTLAAKVREVLDT